MFRKQHIVKIIFFIFFSSIILFAQENNSDNYVFTNYSVQDGLVTNDVRALYQDSIGYLWIGTSEGLERYDGKRFVNLFSLLPSTYNKSVNGVNCIIETKGGVMWIGTRNGGVVKYDKNKNNFIYYTEDPHKPSILSNYIWSFYKYGDDTLIISTSKGANLFKIESEKVEKLPNVGNKKFFSYLYDSRKRLWGATSGGLYLFAKHPFLPSKFDIQKFFNISEKNNNITALVEEPKTEGKILWVASQKTLYRLNIINHTFTAFPIDKLDKSLAPNMFIWSLLFDLRGDLWVGTGGSLGVLKKIGTDYKYVSISNKNKSSEGFIGNAIRTIIQDRGGNIWVGTGDAGFNKYEQKKIIPRVFNHSIASSQGMIYSMAVAGNKLFVGAYRGLLEYNLNSGKYYLMDSYRDNPDGFSSNIRQVYVQPSDSNIIWIPTLDEGLVKYNLTNHSFSKVFEKKENGKYTSYNCIIEDRDKNIWLGTPTMNLIKYIPTKRTSVVVTFPKSVFENNEIRTIYEDKNGIIWIGTSREGLFKYDKNIDSLSQFELDQTDTLKNFCYVYIIKEDKDGNLWIGTNKGLLKHNYLTGETEWNKYNSPRGIAPILSLEFDDNNNIWFSSLFEIGRFDTKRKIFSTYPFEKKQLSSGYYPACSVSLPDGRKIFGGSWEFSVIDPSDLNTEAPNVVITKLHLADSPPILDYQIDSGSTISLENNQNYFSIEFDALNFTASARKKFLYKLEGYDKDWIEAGIERVARYTNVEPGDYLFRVKGSNCDGVWNEKSTNFAIMVLPPFYKTTWAYISYLILLILLVYAIVRFFLYKAQLQNEAIMRQREAEQLQNLDQIKSRFFANISHELRTPLTLILGPLENLSKKENRGSSFLQMYLQAKKLLNMINQLLDISRLESGKMRLKISKRDVVKHIQALIEPFSSLAQNKKIDIKFSYDLPELTAYYDTDKFEKIITNLLGNAFKFSPEEEVILIRLESSNLTEFNGLQFPEGFFRLKVKDNGVGIPNEDAKKVFERFYQVEKNSKKKYGGTGLGLSIVKDFVDMHNGLAYVNTETEKGTEFIIIMPLGKKSYPDAEFEEYNNDNDNRTTLDFVEIDSKSVFDKLEKPTDKDGLKKNILVIEDHEEVNDYIKKILTPAYQVIQTYDGESGVVSAKNSVPDLVVCDIMMPGIDGYEVCRQLKTDEITSHIPIILLTAKASMSSKIEGLETGADDYITKPFSEDELKIRIKNLIKTRESLRSKFAGQINIDPKELSVTSVDEKFLIRIKEIVEKKLSNPDFSVDNFADEVGMSRMTLHRKLKAVTGISTKELIQEMRLRKAALLIEKNFGTIAEIAYEVGFKEPSYFTKCFQKKYNVVPSEYNSRSITGNLSL